MSPLRVLPFALALLPISGFAQVTGLAVCDLLRSAELSRSGREALASKQYPTAARDLREAYKACPSQHGLLLDWSRALSYQREHQEAIQVAREYLQNEPESGEGHVALASALFMAQELAEAKQEAEEALKLDPEQPDALKLRGNCEYLLGETEKAQKTLVELLARHPDDEDAAYMLGRIYYQEGRIDHAIGQFQRVLKINPNSYKAYDNLGLCYEAKSEKEMAIRHFLTAIKMVETDHPEYDWPYANLANLLIDNGDAKQAFSAALKASQRNAHSARNFYLAGKALWKLEQYETSVKWLERSTFLDPDYPEPLYLLARVYSQLGQKDKASETIQRFRDVKSKTPRQRR